MNARRDDPLAPMASDVLSPFIAEWKERARKAQAAVDAILNAGGLRAPRIERRRRGKREQFVLVRRDGDEARLLYGADSKEVTVVLSDREWALIEQVVLIRHGLQPLSLEGIEPEGSHD